MIVHVLPYSLSEPEQDLEWRDLLRSMLVLPGGTLRRCSSCPECLIWTHPGFDDVSFSFPSALSAAVALVDYRLAACK